VFKGLESPEAVQSPYWIANATVFENGMRFPFTPDVLEHYGVVACTHRLKKLALEGDMFNMPMAVGAKASASFPVAFPATTLVCENADDQLNPYLHLLDGGLADNIGYRTAIEVLREDSASHKVLLIIDAYKGASHPHSGSERSPSGVGMAYRITKIGLDAEHALLERDISRLVSTAGDDDGVPIHVITLSFSDLKPVFDQEISSIKEELLALRKKRVAAVVRRLQREIDILLERSRESLRGAESAYALYDDARAIGTSLNITEGEQKILFKAGAVAVQQRLDLFKKYVVLNMQSGGE